MPPDDEPAYLSGVNWGLPASVRVHRLANIAAAVFRCGEDCRIDAFVTLTGDVTLGDRVHLGTGACIFGGAGVTIGMGCSLSPGAKIFTASDDVQSCLLAGPQLAARRANAAAVSVGEFSVIGANAVVLPGVTLGAQVQIGANAVVRTDVPNNEVWGGVPARYLCPRAKLDTAAMMGWEIPANTGA